MLFNDKQTRYKKLLLFIIPLFTLLIIFCFLTILSASSLFDNGLFNSKSTYDIEEFDYHLRTNATDYQKELFKELNKLIKDEASDLEIAESVVKNYIADTYTWDNKLSQWDIGGLCYVHSPSKSLIYTETKDNFYGLLDKYQEDYGDKGLLEVVNIEIESSSESLEKYEYEGKEYDCYDIKCNWEYTENSKFSNEIANFQYFKVIKNNEGRFEIVVCYGNTY